MSLNIEPALSQIPNCVWSHSNQYYADTSALQTINITRELDTDIFVQTSFSIPGKLPITGALIQTFTNENMAHDHFVIYTMPITQIKSENIITIDIAEKDITAYFSLRNILSSLPLVSLIFFNLVLLILPSWLSTPLRYLNIGAILFVGIIYIKMGYRIFQQLVQTKKIVIDGKKITYVDQLDEDVIQLPQLEALIPLDTEHVEQAIIYCDKLYIKQSLIEPSILKNDLTTEEKLEKIQRTLAHITSESFISSFI